MDSLQAGDLRIDVVEVVNTPTIRLNWFGNSNERQPETLLRPFFDTMLEAASTGGKVLELHFERIERFNSSTILAIIKLIQTARQRSVKLVLVYDQTRKWQRLSFDALRIFEKDDGMFALKAVT